MRVMGRLLTFSNFLVVQFSVHVYINLRSLGTLAVPDLVSCDVNEYPGCLCTLASRLPVRCNVAAALK